MVPNSINAAVDIETMIGDSKSPGSKLKTLISDKSAFKGEYLYKPIVRNPAEELFNVV
jgi:hypothetical protein